jgi:hypothetical protein
VDEDGRTHFQEGRKGRHRYLIVNDAQRAQVLKALIELVSRAPDRLP